jgi:integrase
MRLIAKRTTRRVAYAISPHDFRRTFATVADSLDLSPYVIKRLVNHSMTGDVTAGYIVHNVERLRDAAQKIADEFKRLCKVDEPDADNVVPIRG